MRRTLTQWYYCDTCCGMILYMNSMPMFYFNVICQMGKFRVLGKGLLLFRPQFAIVCDTLLLDRLYGGYGKALPQQWQESFFNVNPDPNFQGGCHPFSNALNSGQPHRFGRAFQPTLSEQLNWSKTENLKHFNLHKSFFLRAQKHSEESEQDSGLGRIERWLSSWGSLSSQDSNIPQVRTSLSLLD